ncbi:hypothetical protein RIF29_40491 [Crotalaria pallida]|uniref:Uncharacterized protein n=1 Tax=Crotalaria pallida TaxID=3830 RepID=A0AAN9HUD2_CROPI
MDPAQNQSISSEDNVINTTERTTPNPLGVDPNQKESNEEVGLSIMAKAASQEERRLFQQHHEASAAANSFLKQKAKLKWLQEGDQNSKFFHQAIRQRTYKNRILSIKDELGNQITGQDEILGAFVDFYKKLFTRKLRYQWQEDVVEQGICLNTSQQLKIIQPFSNEEIKNAFHSINIDSAPGPDGYGAGFYKTAWDIVGTDCTQVVKEFFATVSGFKRHSSRRSNISIDFCYGYGGLNQSSGLHANYDKSQLFMAGLTDSKQDELLSLTRFKKGSFPFRYLGMHISARKWSKNTCQILVDKVSNRINYWSSRNLSYQARCCLINSVLLSLHAYWANVFIIPKFVLREMEKKCKAFLWGKNQQGHYTAGVAWDMVCRPKSKVGLNFKNTILWNIAAVGKQIWQFGSNTECLWIKWISSIYLKDIDFWNYIPKSNDSWQWKQLIKIRDRLRPGFVNLTWTVAQSGVYTVNSAYLFLLGNLPPVPWHSFVWNPVSVQKHAFIVWRNLMNICSLCAAGRDL